MDIANLMQSLSINGQDNSVSNFKVFAAEIEELRTDIVFGAFSDEYMLVATQYEKLGSLLKVKKDQIVNDFGSSEPVFTVKAIFGAENIEQQAAARFIAEKLNIDKPLLIFLNLRNYERNTILTIVDVLSDVANRSN